MLFWVNDYFELGRVNPAAALVSQSDIHNLFPDFWVTLEMRLWSTALLGAFAAVMLEIFAFKVLTLIIAKKNKISKDRNFNFIIRFDWCFKHADIRDFEIKPAILIFFEKLFCPSGIF